MTLPLTLLLLDVYPLRRRGLGWILQHAAAGRRGAGYIPSRGRLPRWSW
jgi:hypothetical protein